uniref:Uncharacterized protein n=1 Tax=Arundo donax TaxID=35708 RepID=A0A0A9EVR2_ARUDO
MSRAANAARMLALAVWLRLPGVSPGARARTGKLPSYYSAVRVLLRYRWDLDTLCL